MKATNAKRTPLHHIISYQAIQPKEDSKDKRHNYIFFFWFEAASLWRFPLADEEEDTIFHLVSFGSCNSSGPSQAGPKSRKKGKIRTIQNGHTENAAHQKTNTANVVWEPVSQHYNGNVDHSEFFFRRFCVRSMLFIFLAYARIEIIRLMYITWLSCA